MKNAEYATKIKQAHTASELKSIELEMLNDPDVETLSDCIRLGILIDHSLDMIQK